MSSVSRSEIPGPAAEGREPPVALAVVGPTASGKSHLGVILAQRLGGEVLSVDSRQVYRGLDVGTAKLPARERRGVPHHLIDLIGPEQAMNARDFGVLARRILGEVRARGRLPILVGGSGLYLRAVVRGFFEARVDPGEQAAFRRAARERPTPELRAELAAADPVSCARIHPNDRRRIVRALEVFRLTGRTLSSHHEDAAGPPIEVLETGPRVERTELRARIARRARSMLEGGWIEEVRGLLERGHRPETSPGLRSLGYPEVIGVVEGRLTLEEAREAIVRASRRYAKRQETWFRSEPVRWVTGPPDRMADAIEAQWRERNAPRQDAPPRRGGRQVPP